MASMIAALGPSSISMTRVARIRPTCWTSQRVPEKNRWAREWCQIPARPAPVNIPHTVRSTGRRMNPVNIAVNTSYPGAVKQDRKRCSSDDRQSGTLTLAGIGGTLHSLAVLQTPPMFRPIPWNVRQARRRNGIQFRTSMLHSFGESAIRCSAAPKLRNSSDQRCRRISGYPNQPPSHTPNSAAGMSRPHPAQNGPAGNHRNPDGTSAPPAFPIPWPPPFGRFCPPQSAHPELSPRHAVSVSPPPSPGTESNSPKTSGSRSDKGCSSDRLRSPRIEHPSTPGAPLLALTLRYASHTRCLEILNGLSFDFGSLTRSLPDLLVARTNFPRMVRPLRSPSITEASALLWAGPNADPATVLNPSRFPPLETLPLAIGFPLAVSGLAFPRSVVKAADRARVAYMPGTAWPVNRVSARLILEPSVRSSSDAN